MLTVPPPAAAGLPVLELCGLRVGNGQAQGESMVLPAVDWRVEAGELWLIGGGPGSGKSHLLATCAGLQRPLAGGLKWFGEDTAAMADSQLLANRRRISLVFENGGRLFQRLRVLDNILLPLRYHTHGGSAEESRWLEWVIDVTELGPCLDRLPSELTYPWRQRVALARALSMQPDLLFLDNPLSRLDAAQTRWWLDFIPRLTGESPRGDRAPLAMVVSTDHYPWCDRLACRVAMIHDQSWRVLEPSETWRRYVDDEALLALETVRASAT